MKSSNSTSFSMAFLKAHDAPLISTRPIATQLQIVSLVLDKDNVQEDTNQAFFMHLHQFTRHLYAPLTKFARQHAQQQEVRQHFQNNLQLTPSNSRPLLMSPPMKTTMLQFFRSASASWTLRWSSVSEAQPFPILCYQHCPFYRMQRN
jgi:hypothetical protein